MWKQTKEQAEETKRFYEEGFNFQFIIKEIPGGRGFSINAIRICQNCGNEFEQGGGFDKKATCEDCHIAQRHSNIDAAWKDGEWRRAENGASVDFEESCQ